MGAYRPGLTTNCCDTARIAHVRFTSLTIWTGPPFCAIGLGNELLARMRYFTYIAEQSFKSDNEGHRLFYIGTPFSRPYLIPDGPTESRLFRKLTWYYRIFLSALIFGQPFLIRYFIFQPWLFLAFLASMIALQWFVLRVVFHNDLRLLQRRTARLSLRTFYLGMAQRHSESGLVLGLLGSIAFVICGLFVSSIDASMLAFGLPAVIFFGGCAVAWGYALHLKRAMQRSSEFTTSGLTSKF
jgi:hypothetical protein